MKKEIPEAVKKEAQELLEFLATFDYPHAGELKYLGSRNGVDYYTPYYPEDEEIGFPEVYSFDKNGNCKVYKTFEALHIISSITKK